MLYRRRGGYRSEEEAYEAYGEQLVLFKKKLNLLKETKPSQFEFREYLIYWYHNVYVPRSDGSTKIAAGYVCIGNYGEIKSDGTCNAALKRICNNTGDSVLPEQPEDGCIIVDVDFIDFVIPV